MEAVASLGAMGWDQTQEIGHGGSASDRRFEEGAVMIGVVTERLSEQQMSDEELMSQLRAGDSKSLEQLYDRYVRGCFGLALKIVRDQSVAEEVVQDVFMKLWTQPDRFSPERGKFSAWLLTLVHNRSVDKLRRAGTGVTRSTVAFDADSGSGVTLVETLPDRSPSPYDDAWRNEKGKIVREALKRLPEGQRQTIALAYFGGMTQKEIAEKLDEPLGTIKTRTRAALHQLRRALVHADLLGEV